MDLMGDLNFRVGGFLTVVLIVSIAAGSLLMVAVSLLLLAVFGALAYRARVILRNLDRSQD